MVTGEQSGEHMSGGVMADFTGSMLRGFSGHLTVSFTGIYTFVNYEQIYKFSLVHMNLSRFSMLSPPFLNSYIIFQYNWEMKSRLLLSCKNVFLKLYL